MTDDIPASLVPILRDMKADIELLKDVAASLCILTLAPADLDRLIERLETPIAADIPDATKAIHDAISGFVEKLRNSRPVPKD